VCFNYISILLYSFILILLLYFTSYQKAIDAKKERASKSSQSFGAKGHRGGHPSQVCCALYLMFINPLFKSEILDFYIDCTCIILCFNVFMHGEKFPGIFLNSRFLFSFTALNDLVELFFLYARQRRENHFVRIHFSFFWVSIH
jgi:hypothetical protein